MNPALDKIPTLPEALSGLPDIAMNLAWSWNRDAHELFERIDPVLWAQTRDDPVRLLQEVDPSRLEACAADPEYVALHDKVHGGLSNLETDEGTWFRQTYPDAASGPVAYFCAEFAVHDSIPIYSGGLGILAGDHLKSASDMGIPMVGVGLMYTRGYFDQHFDAEGWQINEDEVFDPARMPLKRLHDPAGSGLASVTIEGRTVGLGAWEMRVGRTRLLLLDSDLEANDDLDRGLTSRLYESGEELRLKQEIILGIGGVRVLDALGIEPGCWHANEGHAALMMVERARRAVAGGASFDEAIASVRSRSVFTTHTPVPAGHDNFTYEQVEKILGPFWDEMGIDSRRFMDLGLAEETGSDRFHMTAVAIRTARHVNGVSSKHGAVTREIWGGMWPDREPEEVPIGSVTNGVHTWTWMPRPVQGMLDQELGEWWTHRVEKPDVWDQVLSMPAPEVWHVRQRMKHRAFRFLVEQARDRWREVWGKARHLVASGPLLDPEVLTLGFARRFATYKRADLLLREEERLLELLTDARRPVQIIFSGKAHPADDEGKRILQRIYKLSHDPRSAGRVAFVQDYEMHVAKWLFRAVDVWLNLPRVPREASGTSGMKAALNLVPQLGTMDGWWAEGFNGKNGWAIPLAPDLDAADEWDWNHTFDLLENDVVPLFYERTREGIPMGWVEMMKQSLWVAGRDYTTGRMLREYATKYYVPALGGSLEGDDPPS
ncbi:MAG: alpha-glucan family phosphorylase [Longimicrobiales bacterium]|nr:alpha-glucan family phosphorylase [Longimicrobiales bacterium]